MKQMLYLMNYPYHQKDVATVQNIAQHFTEIINKLNRINFDPPPLRKQKRHLKSIVNF